MEGHMEQRQDLEDIPELVPLEPEPEPVVERFSQEGASPPKLVPHEDASVAAAFRTPPKEQGGVLGLDQQQQQFSPMLEELNQQLMSELARRTDMHNAVDLLAMEAAGTALPGTTLLDKIILKGHTDDDCGVRFVADPDERCYISEVVPLSQAAFADLQPGDRIVWIQHISHPTAPEFLCTLTGWPGLVPLYLRVCRTLPVSRGAAAPWCMSDALTSIDNPPHDAYTAHDVYGVANEGCKCTEPCRGRGDAEVYGALCRTVHVGFGRDTIKPGMAKEWAERVTGGEVERSAICSTRTLGGERWFGFYQMDTRQAAERLLAQTNKTVAGRRIECFWARSKVGSRATVPRVLTGRNGKVAKLRGISNSSP
eukprot:Hpha_TRINITY_DN14840_c0_g1::TRINITY_DN14840_c0_g1_i1::g.169778::m.169778